MIYDFAVIGGDMRQVYLANYLKNQRYQVITYATKKEGSECKEGKSFENVIREAKCIIGPVVFSKNGEITGSSSNKKMSVETLLQEMMKELQEHRKICEVPDNPDNRGCDRSGRRRYRIKDG